MRENPSTRGLIFATAATVAFVLLHSSGATRAEQSVRPTAAEWRVRIWFVQAGSDDDGSSAARPLGTMAELERVSGAGDVIFVLPSDRALDGGLALKPRQALIGLPEGGRLPAITNSQAGRNGGNGIVLADGARIWNVRVENTYASGVYGADVTGVWVSSVEIDGANRGAATFGTGGPFGKPLPHGGIVFLSSQPKLSATALVTDTVVLKATGVGIATVARAGARHRLVIADSRVEGGAPYGDRDVGVLGLAEGTASDVQLELTRARVLGRMSRTGRNIVVRADAQATASARIDGSYVGESGQDGVIATVANLPAAVDIDIRNTVVENAAQSNVEGTMIAGPPADPARARDARVSISISGSIIRNAGAIAGFAQAGNIMMVGSRSSPDLPFATGRYTLTVRNSTVEGAKSVGIRIAVPLAPQGMPDASTFDVLMREATIARNSTAEIAIAAADVRIDARRNCWGDPAGLREQRVVRNDVAGRAQLDAGEPIACGGPK